jgi:hypothetical protein
MVSSLAAAGYEVDTVNRITADEFEAALKLEKAKLSMSKESE